MYGNVKDRGIRTVADPLVSVGCVFFDSLKQGELLSHWRGVRHRTKWAAFQARYVIWIHWFSVVWFNSAAWDFRRWLEPREVDLACSRVDTHMTLFFQSSVRIGRWALLRRQDWSPSKDWEIFAEMLLGSCCILNESWRPHILMELLECYLTLYWVCGDCVVG